MTSAITQAGGKQTHYVFMRVPWSRKPAFKLLLSTVGEGTLETAFFICRGQFLDLSETCSQFLLTSRLDDMYIYIYIYSFVAFGTLPTS